MTSRSRISVLTALALLCATHEAAAQIIIGRPRPPRPPRQVPADHRPALGVLFGPSARAADVESDGLDLAIVGELPLHDGLRGRVELGALTWDADPAREHGVSRFSLTKATVGLYRVSGPSPMHSFVGGGIGLFRHRADGRRAAGANGGIHGGFGVEYVGRRRAFSGEVRVGLTGGPRQTYPPEYPPVVLHASLLFGVKRVF